MSGMSKVQTTARQKRRGQMGNMSWQRKYGIPGTTKNKKSQLKWIYTQTDI